MKKNKILIATAPFDGHFNPLTGLAIHLMNAGYDVRWYTSSVYKKKLEKLQIPFYPFKQAVEFNQENLNEVFPERAKIKSSIGKTKYDIKHCFVKSAVNYFEDIKEIRKDFPFELCICDIGLTAGHLVKEKLQVPVIAVGVAPLSETSQDTYPSGLGLPPASSIIGKLHMSLMRYVAKNVLFKESHQLYNQIITSYGLQAVKESIFDISIKHTDMYWQIGVPGFEYFRRDISENVHFIGALLPSSTSLKQPFLQEEKLKKYKKIILVSQGTVDNKEPEKLIIPTIEAFKNSPYLVIAATGNSKTEELRKKYSHENVIIEDFVDFSYILPQTDVFVTNGGYGSTLLGLMNNVPIVAAGIHEGKNEICARIGYFNAGINLRTDRPKAAHIKLSVEEILHNEYYKQNVAKLQKEFSEYNTLRLCENYISSLLHSTPAPKRVLNVV